MFKTYAVIDANNATLAVRVERDKAEGCFNHWTSAHDHFGHRVIQPVSLIEIHTDQSETVIAVGFADGKGE